jgi:Carboxypeptidase regulatory-like domain/TonB-dependent Receptor Plug Domain
MTKKWFAGLLIAALVMTFAGPLCGQETAVKGSLGGTVYDTSGAVVPGAKVTLTGPTGGRTQNSDGQGTFLFTLLIPGIYSVKVEKEGFKVMEVKAIDVFTDRASTIHVTLEAGAVSQVVEVTAASVGIDTASTAIGANLPDDFYRTVPVSRNVAGLFYLSPGVASGGKSGAANPSISGGSGLENLYVADGVNITDSAFGGLGTFSRNYGSLGTGINLSFIKEVQVKTGGYEPQYGKATGGIVQIVTKSGSKEYHGAISGFFQPQQFEATRLHSDDFGRQNLSGKILHQESYDASGEFGGYVPGLRNKLFFFGSINPSYSRDIDLSPASFGLSALGQMRLRTNALNYAGKLTYKITDKQTLETSIFGDPAHTSTGPFLTLTADNPTVFSKLEFGTRNWAVRWNGLMTPGWVVNASFTWGNNYFHELPTFPGTYLITDQTQTSGLPGQRGQFTAVGYGFNEPTESNSYGFNIDTQKDAHFLGKHTFSLGYRLERPFYDGSRLRTGPRFPIPATNATGRDITTLGVPASAVGQLTNATFQLRRAPSSCTLCPLFNVPGRGNVPVFLRQSRGEFGPTTFSTTGHYAAIYGMESWSPFKYLTVNAGLRWEQQRLVGTDINYAFVDNWSPRVGFIVDPRGNRKTKIYGNYGRYNYVIPLDLAERSLSNELDFIAARWAPDFTTNSSGQRIATVNSFGTVNPVLDAAHLLSGAKGGTGGAISVSLQSTEGFLPGTKMEYIDEFVGGFERELRGGIVVGARFIYRRFGRIVEDTGGISPEAANAGVNQNFVIANVSKSLDAFTNPISHIFPSGGTTDPRCDPNLVLDPVEDTFGNNLGAVCFETNGVNGQPAGAPISDGVPDGFPNASRVYKALEIEVNKAFSKNWQLRANYRLAKLFGNFEGAFRNDNGQTDPGISSLFDFTQGQFNLLGDQFKPGVLNTDRRHVANLYVSYVLGGTRLTGMTFGLGVRGESGIPVNDLKAHPVYLNAGEVPVGGRGALGRTAADGSVDVHADYPFKFGEKKRLRFGVDLFNIFDFRKQIRVDEFEDISFGTANTDFRKPVGDGPRATPGFERPFYARTFVRFEF